VQGVPVLGTLEQVAPLLASGQVAQVVVSTESVARERLDALQRLCADAGVRTLHASIQFRDAADPS
jgi:FlaA1/EpsC-like NDP-sugar epimerase